MSGKVLLTSQEVAERLRVSVNTVHRLAKQPDGLESIRVGNLRRFTEEAVDAYIAKSVETPPPALAPRRRSA